MTIFIAGVLFIIFLVGVVGYCITKELNDEYNKIVDDWSERL